MYRARFILPSLLVSAVALFAPSAVRAEPVSAATNPWELTLNGNAYNDNSFHEGGFNVSGSVGYFLDETWEVSLRQNFGYVDSGGDNVYTASTRVGVDYHFDLGQFRPFVGANIGFLYGDAFRDTWAAGPEAGLKYFVNDTTFLYGTVGYDVFFRNASDAEGNFDDGQFVYTVGIGFRW